MHRLDNGRFNDLYLEPEVDDPRTWLCVGGGNGRYLLSGVEGEEGEELSTLVDPSRPEEPARTLVVGGQEGTYSANRVHSLETAINAVREFWSKGRFSRQA